MENHHLPDNTFFHQIISLQDQKELSWESFSNQAPLLPRGWFELSRLSPATRVEFTYEYWLAKLSIESDGIEQRLDKFFQSLASVDIFLTQERDGLPLEPHMIYSFKEPRNSLHGAPAATNERIEAVQRQFSHFNLPADYLNFLQIHDGFGKGSDVGLIRTRDISRAYNQLKERLMGEMIMSDDGSIINPEDLVPFYESQNLHCFQCFYPYWTESEGEMGNLFFCEPTRSISNTYDREQLEDNLAFATFLDWLLFYIESGST